MTTAQTAAATQPRQKSRRPFPRELRKWAELRKQLSRSVSAGSPGYAGLGFRVHGRGTVLGAYRFARNGDVTFQSVVVYPGDPSRVLVRAGEASPRYGRPELRSGRLNDMWLEPRAVAAADREAQDGGRSWSDGSRAWNQSLLLDFWARSAEARSAVSLLEGVLAAAASSGVYPWLGGFYRGFVYGPEGGAARGNGASAEVYPRAYVSWSGGDAAFLDETVDASGTEDVVGRHGWGKPGHFPAYALERFMEDFRDGLPVYARADAKVAATRNGFSVEDEIDGEVEYKGSAAVLNGMRVAAGELAGRVVPVTRQTRRASLEDAVAYFGGKAAFEAVVAHWLIRQIVHLHGRQLVPADLAAPLSSPHAGDEYFWEYSNSFRAFCPATGWHRLPPVPLPPGNPPFVFAPGGLSVYLTPPWA